MNTNTKEILISYFFTILEIYKVIMACLLSIFIPQYFDSNIFYDISNFNKFVIFFNFITLILFIYFYYVQQLRETFFINHLEINKSKSYYSLKENLKSNFIYNKVEYYNLKIYFFIKYYFIIYFNFLLF